MITISKLSGEEFLTINYDINQPIKYKDMKLLFDTNIIIDSINYPYYMLINKTEKIYSNFYDIFKLKSKKKIRLDNLNIIFLPYNKEDVAYIQNPYNYFRNCNFPNENLKSDKLFILMAVNKYCGYYKKIKSELKYDKEIIMNAALSDPYYGSCLNYIPAEYKSDKEFMKFYIKINGYNIRFASEELKNDEELVNLAISSDFGNVLQYLPDVYKDNEELVLLILNKYPKCFEYISTRLQNKKEIIMLCIEKLKSCKYNNNNILQLINNTNKNDKEIVLLLVSMNGNDIQYVSNTLALDKDIVHAAIRNDPTAYKYIHESFFNNKEFILLCLNNNNIISNGYDKNYYEDFLEDLNDEFKDDKDIVIASIRKCCKNINYCSKRLRNDKQVILTAIDNCYYDFYDNITDKDKFDYIKKRIENIDVILKKTKLKNDPDVLKQVIKKITIY